MQGLSRPVKSFADLLPVPALSWLSSVRRLLLGGSVTGLGLLGLSPAVPAEARTPATAPVATLSERQRKQPRLVLTLRHAAASFSAVMHRSHSSHSSHRSHSSHSSHYSGSGGTAPRVYVPSTPVATPTPPPAVVAQEVSMTVTDVDTARRTLTGDDEFGTRWLFHYRDDTQVASPAGGHARLDEYMETASALPFQAGQKVKVAWKASSDHKKRMATRVDVMP